MGMAMSLLPLLWFPPCTAVGDGSYRKDYPPWGEPGSAMYGKPRFLLPILIRLSRSGCGPSRYMAMRIAASHINRRDATFCPAINSLTTDFEVSYEVADSSGEGSHVLSSLRHLEEQMTANGTAMQVLLGPDGSGASMAVSAYLAGLKIPHISWAATNAQLSDKETYGNFFRVVSPDSLAMRILVLLFESFKFEETHLIYFDAPFQSGQATEFQEAADKRIQVNRYKLPNSGRGGKKVSEANWPKMIDALNQIRSTQCRVVAAFAVNEEAYDLWKAAYDHGMIRDQGWVWVGGDGIGGSQLNGDVNRVKFFEGTLFIKSMTQTSRFKAFSERWAQDMRETQTPEFHTMPFCSGGIKCDEHEEFSGWNLGQHNHDLLCDAYTGLAYDAFVTLMVVLDRLLTRTGKRISSLSEDDWMTEMRALSQPSNAFLCVTDEIVLDDNQDRRMSMALLNYHPQKITPMLIGSWNHRTAFSYEVGKTVFWPSGEQAKIEDVRLLPRIPKGRSPVQEDKVDDEDSDGLPLLIIVIVAILIIGVIAVILGVSYRIYKKRKSKDAKPCKTEVFKSHVSSPGDGIGAEVAAERRPSPRSLGHGRTGGEGGALDGEDGETTVLDTRMSEKPDSKDGDDSGLTRPSISSGAISQSTVQLHTLLSRPILSAEDITNVLATLASGRMPDEICFLKQVHESISRGGEEGIRNPDAMIWKGHLDTIRNETKGESKGLAVKSLCLIGWWGSDDIRGKVVTSIKSTLVCTGDDDVWLQVAGELGQLLSRNKCNEEDIGIATNGLLEGLSKSKRVEGTMMIFNDLMGPPCILGKDIDLVVNRACQSLTSGLDKEPKICVAKMLGSWIGRGALEMHHRETIKEKMKQIVRKVLRENSTRTSLDKTAVVGLVSSILQDEFDIDLESGDLAGDVEHLLENITGTMERVSTIVDTGEKIGITKVCRFM